MILSNTPNFTGHTIKLETIYVVLVEDINATIQPMVFFTHTNEI